MQWEGSEAADLTVSGWPYMELALDAARQAARAGEVPIGAVVVRGDEVLSVAHNAPIALQDPTGHAEILALRMAAQRSGNYRLPGTTMYVTAEPCVMCVGAILQARVAHVVYGCREPKGGALGTAYDLGRDRRSNHRLSVIGGVRAEEASAVLREFFHLRRGA